MLRIYLKEVARCAKQKFKTDPQGSESSASSKADVILEIDQRSKVVSVIRNRFGGTGKVEIKK